MVEVKIDLDYISLYGELNFPENSKGIVIFAHGSGSSRFSPRNKYVSEELNKEGIATLLFDLLSIEEERVDLVTRAYRFDIELLANRLILVTKWVEKNPELSNLTIGYFGASTGAAAALIAAAELPNKITAVVCRGGRVDLADKYLDKVEAPSLFIVGEFDEIVINLNKKTIEKLNNISKLEVVKGATHLFEEPGTLEEVNKLSMEWFKKYLV